jgi:hypothetical protein
LLILHRQNPITTIYCPNPSLFGPHPENRCTEKEEEEEDIRDIHLTRNRCRTTTTSENCIECAQEREKVDIIGLESCKEY